jgi:hypothetical protein
MSSLRGFTINTFEFILRGNLCHTSGYFLYRSTVRPKVKPWQSTPKCRYNTACKGKVHPRTGHEGPEWLSRYSSTPLTYALERVGTAQ